MDKFINASDFLTIVISKNEIESRDILPTVKTLTKLVESNESMKQFFQRVEISVDGYNQDPRELWDIPEVKTFIQLLDKQFPYWFYFLTNFGAGLKVISFCCNNLIKLTATQVWIEPASLEKFYHDHFIAMNVIADKIGMTDKENEELTEQILNYFSNTH